MKGCGRRPQQEKEAFQFHMKTKNACVCVCVSTSSDTRLSMAPSIECRAPTENRICKHKHLRTIPMSLKLKIPELLVHISIFCLYQKLYQ